NDNDNDINKKEEKKITPQKHVVVLCNIVTMLAIPLYFGKITEDNVKELRRPLTKKELRHMYVRKWIFNSWNYFWWACGGLYLSGYFLHSFFSQTPSHLSHTVLFATTVALPLLYPCSFALFALNARRRLRKLQKLILSSKSKSTI
ncbi:hypothetical protein RFI_36765, partial [Reticulomyxa filosa]